MKTNTQKSLLKAIEIVGGQTRLAEFCHVSQPTVFGWIKYGRVPAQRVIQIEKIVEGKVTRHELRPDLYPLETPS